MATIPFPDYRKPPVVEVAIALQFDAIQELTAAHAGLYWKTIRSNFGRVEEQPPIPSLPDVSSWEGGGPQSIFTIGKPPMPRLWFIDGTSTRIIQLQRDKFIHNCARWPLVMSIPGSQGLERTFSRTGTGSYVSWQRAGCLHPTSTSVNLHTLIVLSRARAGRPWRTSRVFLPHLFGKRVTAICPLRTEASGLSTLPFPDNRVPARGNGACSLSSARERAGNSVGTHGQRDTGRHHRPQVHERLV